MDTLLKPGYERIMKLFYEHKKESLHLREIVRKTGMNENSAKRFLDLLEKEKILVSKKDGNMRKFSICKNENVFSIFAYFDIAKLNGLDNLRRNAINYFIDRMEEKPVIAFVFGSTAKGTTRKDSDVDILLIVNQKIKTEEAERYAESQTGIRASIFQILYKDFKLELKIKEDKVIASALSTGFPVTNHRQYYREVFEEWK